MFSYIIRKERGLERWLIYWITELVYSLYKKYPTQNPESITVGSAIDILQSIDYSRINHLYKINTVTLNAFCLWDFEEGEDGKCSGQDRYVLQLQTKGGKKLYQKYFYVKVKVESPCVSHCYYLFLKGLRKFKEKINHNRWLLSLLHIWRFAYNSGKYAV